MKLFGNPASPYVRILRVMAAEAGVPLELEIVKVHPCGANPEVAALNPSGRIPTAILPDGSALYDSRSIARWIAARPEARIDLYPGREEIWPVLRREAMAQNVLDTAIPLHYELRIRPQAFRWPDWIDGQREKLRRFVSAIAEEIDEMDSVDAASISVACALSYFDFRHADLDWRGAQPALAKWHCNLAGRASMQSTRPE